MLQKNNMQKSFFIRQAACWICFEFLLFTMICEVAIEITQITGIDTGVLALLRPHIPSETTAVLAASWEVPSKKDYRAWSKKEITSFVLWHTKKPNLSCKDQDLTVQRWL